MTSGRLAAVTVAAGAVGLAGLGGYLLSEARHADSSVPVAEAASLPAPAAPPEATRAAADPAGSPLGAPAREKPTARPVRSAPVAPTPAVPRAETAASDPAPALRESGPPPPPPLPVMTSTVPVTDTPPLPDAVGVPVAIPEPLPDTVELTVERGAVVGVRLDQAVSSATARVEDRVVGVVTREVIVDGRTVIPAGTRVEGYVTLVEPGGKFREKARIGLQFTTVVLSPAERLPISTETIFRDGESPTGEATSKIGASAVVGTVLGAIIGGKKGAAIGGAAGAAGGTAAVVAGGANDAVLAAGTSLTLRLTDPVAVVVRRDRDERR